MDNQISLDNFSQKYESVHEFLSIIVCTIGCVLNIFNVIVLTRKHMISSTNKILAALAVSNFLTMIAYIPVSVKYFINIFSENESYIDNCGGFKSYFWTVYLLFYPKFMLSMHSSSIWLTILLAFFRYISICRKKIGIILCSKKYTNLSILSVYIFCILLCSPVILQSKIIELDCSTANLQNTSYNVTTKVYDLYESDIDIQTKGFIFKLIFFTQAIFFKIIPCILLIVFSCLLVHSIHITCKSIFELQRNDQEIKKTKDYNRINIMLLLVCISFFLTEFPQGVLTFLCIVFESKHIYENIYMKLDDIVDLITLFNSAINFIIYCLMSREYRETFKHIFMCLKNPSQKMVEKLEYSNQIRSL